MSEKLSWKLNSDKYTIVHHSKEFIKIFNGLNNSICVEVTNDDFDTVITIRSSTPTTNLEEK